MILSNLGCLYIYFFLYGGAIISLFIRAFVRRRLLKDYEEIRGDNLAKDDSSWLFKALLAIPKRMQALRMLRKTIDDVPESVQRRLKRFELLNWIVIVMVVLLVGFSLTAHKICN